MAASTCSYRDWYGTDLVIFFGSNPANDQPVAMKYLYEAKKLGTKVVLVNPLLEPGMKKYWVPSNADSGLFGTEVADWWFPVAQGGDIALLYGVLRVLVVNGWVDERFLAEHGAGWSELKAAVLAQNPAALAERAGLPWSAIEEFAGLIHGAKNALLVWSMGITQHRLAGMRCR